MTTTTTTTTTQINSILFNLLTTKRPTNNAGFCLSYTQGLLRQYDIQFTTDAHMNITVDNAGTTCFTAHQDTVGNKLGTNSLVIDNVGLLSVEGGGVLGADDGSGMYVMIRMILAGKPGLYVFFSTEEQGRIGSSAYTMPAHITKCISFDRKGTDNLITHQMGERGCSDAFADAFISAFALPFKKDPTGSFTDSYSFFGAVPECINMSVGYYSQHTKNESQDVPFLESLVDACIALDWESLPVERDPTTVEWEDDDWDWYKQGNKKYESKYYGSYKPIVRSVDDFVYEYPWAVSDLLETYGITLADLEAHKDMLEGVEDAA